MANYVHYSVWAMSGGGLARGMYTCSAAYETPELAAELGPSDPHLTREADRYALVRVETRDELGPRGPYRQLDRAVILRVL